MNKEEKHAREVCAWCNWVKECEDCPHRDWPSGAWLKEPLFNWRECEQWKHYLRSPYRRFINKIRIFFKLHKWFKVVEYSPFKIVRTCMLCGRREEFIKHTEIRSTKGLFKLKGKRWSKID